MHSVSEVRIQNKGNIYELSHDNQLTLKFFSLLLSSLMCFEYDIFIEKYYQFRVSPCGRVSLFKSFYIFIC